MKTFLMIFGILSFTMTCGQCIVDEIEYVEMYSDNHCTSSSLSNTKVIIIPRMKQERVGTIEWKIKYKDSFAWEDVPDTWIHSTVGELVNYSVDSTDNYALFLATFIENGTGCRDSAIKRLVLDYSPSIRYSSHIIDGKVIHFAENMVFPSLESNQITWFDRFGLSIAMGDTLISSIVPCEVQIVDCVGCIERISINNCRQEPFFIPSMTDGYIYLSSNRSCSMELFDISGRLIERVDTIQSTMYILDTKKYSNGLYVLRVCDESSIMLISH